jgi:hypothetical protein
MRRPQQSGQCLSLAMAAIDKTGLKFIRHDLVAARNAILHGAEYPVSRTTISVLDDIVRIVGQSFVSFAVRSGNPDPSAYARRSWRCPRRNPRPIGYPLIVADSSVEAE